MGHRGASRRRATREHRRFVPPRPGARRRLGRARRPAHRRRALGRPPRRRAARRAGHLSRCPPPTCPSSCRCSTPRSTPATAWASTSRSRTARPTPDFDPSRSLGRAVVAELDGFAAAIACWCRRSTWPRSTGSGRSTRPSPPGLLGVRRSTTRSARSDLAAAARPRRAQPVGPFVDEAFMTLARDAGLDGQRVDGRTIPTACASSSSSASTASSPTSPTCSRSCAADAQRAGTRSRTSGSWRNVELGRLAEVVAVDLVRERP